MGHLRVTCSFLTLGVLTITSDHWYWTISELVRVVALFYISYAASGSLVHLVNNRLHSKVCPFDKAVLVTGCASGFGFSTALELNRLGYFVFAGVRQINDERARNLLKCALDKSRFKLLKLDVTNELQVAEAVKKIKETLEKDAGNMKLHAIVNNAGFSELSILESGDALDVDTFRQHLQVNFISAVRLTKVMLPLIRKSKGRIVNVSSAGARLGAFAHFMSAYGSAKAALSYFTESLDEEIHHTGARAISIEPLTFKSGLANSRAIADSVHKSLDRCNDEVKNVYEFQSVQKLNLCVKLLESEYYAPSDCKSVVDAIVDAVSFYEPSRIYSPVPRAVVCFHWMLTLVPGEMTICLFRLFCKIVHLTSGKVKSMAGLKDKLLTEQKG